MVCGETFKRRASASHQELSRSEGVGVDAARTAKKGMREDYKPPSRRPVLGLVAAVLAGVFLGARELEAVASLDEDLHLDSA